MVERTSRRWVAIHNEILKFIQVYDKFARVYSRLELRDLLSFYQS